MLILRCCKPIMIFLFFAILTFDVRLTLLIGTVIVSFRIRVGYLAMC